MRNLYLIRHGKPQYPDEHSYCIGQTDFSLSMLGHLQSVLLHGELDDKITAVYCSPLSRAMETAAHITPDLPHITISDLTERNLGEWDGLSFDEIRKRWPDLYEARGMNPDYPIRLPCGSYYHLNADDNDHVGLSDSTYLLPHPDLHDELCRMLRDSVSLPHHVQAHSDAVTELACHFCDLLESHGYFFNKKLIRSGALLHDIARLQKHHTKTGGDLFLQLGYTEISQIISQHHGLQKTLLNEAAIVFLSDKLIQETERVTIEKRFAESLCKCNSPEALKSHERQLKQALDLQNMIQTICHMTI